MNRIPLAAAVALTLLIVPPAAATLVLADVAFTPNPPFNPGGRQQGVSQFAVIPAGATTFAPGHTLQMETALDGAQWSIQVTLDGRDAAHQTASGRVAFVNGVILSYGTNHDVGMTVTINGTVPAGAAGPVTVLQVKEIDNTGHAVPGSTLTVSQPLSFPPATTPVLPPRTPTPFPAATPPARAPGLSALLAITGGALGILFISRRGR